MPPLLVLLLILAAQVVGIVAILNLTGVVKMKTAEFVGKMNTLADRVDKVKTEVQALKDVIAAADDVPQSVLDAFARVDASVAAVDDLNEDAPPAG